MEECFWKYIIEKVTDLFWVEFGQPYTTHSEILLTILRFSYHDRVDKIYLEIYLEIYVDINNDIILIIYHYHVKFQYSILVCLTFIAYLR